MAAASRSEELTEVGHRQAKFDSDMLIAQLRTKVVDRQAQADAEGAGMHEEFFAEQAQVDADRSRLQEELFADRSRLQEELLTEKAQVDAHRHEQVKMCHEREEWKMQVEILELQEAEAQALARTARAECDTARAEMTVLHMTTRPLAPSRKQQWGAR